MPEVSATVPLSRRRTWALGAAVGLVSLTAFGFGLAGEPEFVDEWAYVSQAYFTDLLLQPNHPAWLEYPAFDLPPLPKYGIGFGLKLAGFRPPPLERRGEWYENTHTRFGPPAMLTAARRPSVVLGAIGCVAVFALGTLAADRRVGLLAAGLLILDPLYRMHARRAMSDVYAEALILATTAVGLWAWRAALGRAPAAALPPRGRLAVLLGYLAAGLLGGLAVLSKFNGVLGLLVLGAWAALAAFLPGVSWGRKGLVLGGAKLAGVVAFATFAALNPFLTAHPAGTLPQPLAELSELSFLRRCWHLVDHRLEVPRSQQKLFAHNALLTLEDKLSTVAVQGFGRFGPLGRTVADAEHPGGWFDSTKRYDWNQDAGAVIWLPWTLAGAVWAARRGRFQSLAGQPPTAWAVLVQAFVALGIVTSFLPLAWDRFFLSIQPGSCLLAAGVAVAAIDTLRTAWPRRGAPGAPQPERSGRGPALLLFLTLLGSDAFFWHARDWNISSRLMLTYALADRGTVRINGLEDHTRDRARIGRDYYSDKLPGFSLLAVPPYLAAKAVLGLPEHPLNRPGPGFTHWPADYAITLGTSGLATALTGVLLTAWAIRLGCGPRRAALVGLAYGLATPAYAYATLGYGHQVTAAALLGSFAVLWNAPGRSRSGLRAFAAGFLAALAVTVELQVAPVGALLGSYLLALVVGRRLPVAAVLWFGVGALGPLLALLGYNMAAFGSPFDMGYFHEDIAQFRQVHSRGNPLGLRMPDWGKAAALLWGEHRGLLFYAPILILALPGWIVLGVRRLWGLLAVTALTCAAMFLVNLSYPEWTGGWSTGPRLLLPLVPFAMLPVAGLLTAGGRWATSAAVALALVGGVLILLFQGVGARVPQDLVRPLREFVWPAWSGAPPVLGIDSERFARNLGALAFRETIAGLPATWQWVQFLPLVVFQVVMIGLILRVTRRLA